MNFGFNKILIIHIHSKIASPSAVLILLLMFTCMRIIEYTSYHGIRCGLG